MNLTARLHLMLFVALLAAVGTAGLLAPRPAPAETAADPAPVAGEPMTLDDGSQAVAGEILVGYPGDESPQTVPIPATADPETVADKVEEHPDVSYAIPNYIAHASGWLPDDPGHNIGPRGKKRGWTSRQWNFLPCLSLCHPSTKSSGPQSRGGMNVVGAWRHLRKAGRPGAAGVRIAVLDTGIAYRDRGRRFRRSPDFGPNRFLPGFDFVSHDRYPLDLNGHGTHVASTIGEETDNGRGLTGIAYRSKLMPVRVMDENGDGDTADIAAGIRWATRHGARIISMSLNFECGKSIPPVEEALREAHRKGVILVGSSGNIPRETCPSLPATAPEVISVGANTESGCLATYSFKSTEIDIAAPGGGRSRPCPFSSRERPIMQVGMIGRQPDWFGIQSGWVGTSMAAAHVSGAAAAVIASGVLGRSPGPGKVFARLASTSRTPAFAAGDPASGFGAGIIDVGRATNPAVPNR